MLNQNLPELMEGLSFDDVMKICGIIDANSFKIDKHGTRGVFLATSMVSNKLGDDISSGSFWFDFCLTDVVQLSNRKYVFYGCLTTIDNSLPLDLNRCYYPLITYLSK